MISIEMAECTRNLAYDRCISFHFTIIRVSSVSRGISQHVFHIIIILFLLITSSCFGGEKQRMFQSILLSLLDFIASINYLWQFQIFVFIICCCCFSVCLMFFLSIFLYASSKKELIFHHEVEKIRPNVLTYPILL